VSAIEPYLSAGNQHNCVRLSGTESLGNSQGRERSVASCVVNTDPLTDVSESKSIYNSQIETGHVGSRAEGWKC